MKANKLLVMAGIASLCVSTLGGAVANAESDSKAGQSEGKVEFVKDGDDVEKPITPTEPPEIVEPPVTEPPINPVPVGEATLLWYPNLNFGRHKYDEMVVNKYDAIITDDDQWMTYPGAVGYNDEDQPIDADGNVIEGVATDYPALVQVKNTPKATAWDLKVSLGDFIKNDTSGGAGDVLSGATIQIANNELVTGMGNAAKAAAASFTLTPGEDEDGNPLSTPLLSYTKPANDETTTNSYNSLKFGTVSETTSNAKSLVMGDEGKYVEDTDVRYNNGVTLVIPANLSVDEHGYSAQLDWTLTCEF